MANYRMKVTKLTRVTIFLITQLEKEQSNKNAGIVVMSSKAFQRLEHINLPNIQTFIDI